jgi:Tfp pilus assembly major pilin PilA
MSMVYCRGCGKEIHESAPTCPHCGAPQKAPSTEKNIPDGVRGWSWGAFLLNWIWAIGNKTWIGLLALIPYVGLIMAIVLGIKGREWAWKNKEWASLEEFNRVQRQWSKWAVIVVFGIGGIGILAAIAIPQYQAYNQRAREAQLMLEQKQEEARQAEAQAQLEAQMRQQAEAQAKREAELQAQAQAQMEAEQARIAAGQQSNQQQVALAEEIPTRFGSLKINGENMLLYKNRPLKPEIQGNNSLSTVGIYQIGISDVVLIQDNGGTACPAQFYFVSISNNGVMATSPFGTCSDLVEVKQVAETISVTMPGFMGSFESQEAQRKAAKEKHVFAFKGGVLTENGMPIK